MLRNLPRVGSVGYATDSGLGILVKSFYNAGVVTDIAVIRHGRHTTHDDWYPNAPKISDLRSAEQRLLIHNFCLGMDVMLFFETPFLWELIPYCRQHGVRTILMPMYECMPERLPYEPDAIINPSLLDQQYYPQGTFIPVPVQVPWKQRTKAEVFIHNAGHGGLKGRNGTRELIEALYYVDSPCKIIIRAQDQLNTPNYHSKFTVQTQVGTSPHETLYDEGDVFLFPEKFNGLSLPLQEARASGMLVMCGDRFPMNEWLPTEIGHGMCPACGSEDFAPSVRYGEDARSCADCCHTFGVEQMARLNPLIPVSSYRKNRIGPPYSEFDEAVFDPKKIATKIDEWYGRDITEYSSQGKVWAEEHSWEKLKPRYMEFIKKVVQ